MTPRPFLAAFLLVAGCATLAAPALSPSENRLVEAIADRLAFAREVAWVKYLDGRPVRDPKREAAVLDAVAAAAPAHGLDPAAVRAFFAAQIAASCAQQEKFLHLWRRGAPLPTYAPRSTAEVRRDIDAANEKILRALAAGPVLSPTLRRRAERSLRARGIHSKAARLASAPL